jgi:hypothetical protein
VISRVLIFPFPTFLYFMARNFAITTPFLIPFVSRRARFGFPTTRSIARRGVYIGRFTRITPTAIVSVTSPFFLFTSSKWNSGLRGVSRASYDVYDGIVRVFAPGL